MKRFRTRPQKSSLSYSQLWRVVGAVLSFAVQAAKGRFLARAGAAEKRGQHENDPATDTRRVGR